MIEEYLELLSVESATALLLNAEALEGVEHVLGLYIQIL